MRAYLSSLAVVALSIAAVGQDCTSAEFANYSEVQSAVLRLLSTPGYATSDEKILNSSGDIASVAIMRSLSMEAMDNPQNRRQILRILQLAFEAPRLVKGCGNQNPTATMLLLDHLERSKNSSQPDNEINNTRFLVKHNATTGQPLVLVSGERQIDWDHTNWVDSVLRWLIEIKPGMTRKDILKIFTTEGGLSFGRERRYVLKQCPFIKVDVDFAPAAAGQSPFTDLPDDKITKISRPYLEYSIMD